MGLSVNTNIAALNAYRNLSSTQSSLNSSLEKLSSGLRINRAADDAAGLSISEGLRAQISGTQQAVRNAQDGISVVQTAEGALTETHSILQRMRTLSVQAANDGGLSSDAKDAIQAEMGELTSELDRIASTTQFNGSKLLDGTYTSSFQVGANTSADDKINVAIGAMDSTTLGVDSLKVNDTATTYAAEVDLFGAAPVSSDMVVDGTTVTLDLSTWDAGGDAAAAEANMNLLQTELNSGLSAVGMSATVDEFGTVTLSGSFDGTETVDILDNAGVAATAGAAGDASAAINAIDAAITSVSTQRSNLGAIQNRFDHTINNLNVSNENLTASESRIRDTDMASEMVNYTRDSILSQAGTAMLAQAKSLPQSILQLLQ
jgi:flagellin